MYGIGYSLFNGVTFLGARGGTPPSNTVAPVISGTNTVGSTLSCTTGTWTGSPAPTYAYQWKRGGVDIGGATSSTYTLVSADGSTNITCTVTATNVKGSASATSNTIAVAAQLILDLYPAAAAYSLRKISTSATNAIRVRRSSDNAEQDFGFVGNDLDTASLLTFVGAGSGYITKWYDQTPTGGTPDLSQPNASEQPRIVNAGTLEVKGSKAAVKFDGSDDSIYNFSAPIVNTTSTSYFSVSAAGSTGINAPIHTQYSIDNNSIRTFCDARATPNIHLAITNTVPTTFLANLSTARVNTNQRLLSSFIDASKNMSAFDNGATGGTATYTGTTNSDGLSLGNQTTSYGNLHIQEFIAFNTNESANRTAIESNINTYYGIY